MMALLFLGVVLALIALLRFDLHLHKIADDEYLVSLPKKLRRRILKNYAKNIWTWCEDLLVSISENRTLVLVSILFAFFFIGFVLLFYFSLWPLISLLYVAIDEQIRDIKVGSYAFRNVSLSIGGSITLSIAVLGLFLSVIRNIISDNQNKAADEQNRINERGRITESIGQAITHIGTFNNLSPNIEVRLGGIYSLQRIMRDSLKDEEAIAKIFYAYVRQNAREYNEPNDDAREDVQATLDILAELNDVQMDYTEPVPPRNRVNFSHTNLTGYLITGKNFVSADLDYIIFQHGNLSNKQFFYASMIYADLSYTNLSESYFVIADLSNADLSNADLSNANLHRADLFGADLSTAKNLTQEQIDEADGDDDTKLPKGLTRPEHWIKKKKPAKKKTKKSKKKT